tara:strand:+ start:12542 stop:13738 length:1197 start_codon:yes stop_codon:yes gene_type:complete
MLQGIQYLLPFLVMPIMTAALGANKFGVLMYWASVLAGLSVLVDFGFGYVGGREAAKKDFRFSSISELYSSILVARFLVLLFSFVLLFLIFLFSPEPMRMPYAPLLVVLGLIGAAISPLWLLLASKMTGCIAISGFAGQLLLLGIAYFCVRDENDLWLALLAQCASLFVNSFFASIFVFLYIRPALKVVKLKEALCMLKSSFSMFLSTSSAAVYSVMNPFVIGVFGSPESVATFALAERIVKAFLGLISPVLSVLYPYSIRQARNGEYWAKGVTFAVVLFASLLIAVLNCGAESLILYFGGDGFEGVLVVVRILSFSIFFVVLGNIAGIHWLVARGYDRSVFFVTGFAAFLYFMLFPAQVLKSGVVGGAWVLLLIETCVCVGFLLMVLRVEKKKVKET